MSSSVTRSIAAERNGIERSMPQSFVLREASAGSIELAAGRMSTSSKVNPRSSILATILHYTPRARTDKPESSPTQDGTQIEDDSSVKGAEVAPRRGSAYPAENWTQGMNEDNGVGRAQL